MRTRTKQLFRVALVSLSVASSGAIAPGEARAEADAFGVGDGHRGAFAAVGDEPINAYAPLTADAAVGATTLTFGPPIGNLAPPIGTTNGFATGDLVMIWRATGVPAATAQVASGNQTRVDLASNAIDSGRVGTFEFARVQAANATSITLTKPFVRAWPKDLTQIVRVPEYTTVSVPAGTSIPAVKWTSVGTGFAGGIVAFLASGVVTIDGVVNANAAGFRGGKADATPADVTVACPDLDGTEATGYAAKGEGIVSTEFGGTTHSGRGNRANGAGGGNCTENGGGGGGGFGAGGTGGRSIVANDRSGLGGVGLDYSLLTRFTMGGGGGAGEQKNGGGSAGGQGGGMIFVRARAVAGGGTFTANGQTADNATPISPVESDGAGGGGAGGNILIRAVDTVACQVASTNGGNGGDTQVVGLGPFGAGGGGGGGRVLIQAKAGGNCTVSVLPGAGGQSGITQGTGGAAGVGGEPSTAPPGNFCFDNPPNDPQCANPDPVCDTTTGACGKCTGPFGGGPPRPCNIAVMPVCAAAGTCNACDGDFGTGATLACQLTAAPYCFLAGAAGGAVGSCGKCTSNADCTDPAHGGTVCNVTVGQCGKPCQNDSECPSTQWCAEKVCISKTPNSQMVPKVPAEMVNGECTEPVGKRVCLSAVCEPDDDLCGLKNGSPCDGVNERCRSTVCFPGDKRCGKPAGEPCMAAGECRTNECTNNVCAGCDDDSDCVTNKVCDAAKKQCVDGCREVGGKSNCDPAGKECSKHDGTIGQCIPKTPGGDGGADGGEIIDAGVVEGGGCACRTSMPFSGSPIALAAAAASALLLARRRLARKKKSRAITGDDDDNRKANQDQG